MSTFLIRNFLKDRTQENFIGDFKTSWKSSSAIINQRIAESRLGRSVDIYRDKATKSSKKDALNSSLGSKSIEMCFIQGWNNLFLFNHVKDFCKSDFVSLSFIMGKQIDNDGKLVTHLNDRSIMINPPRAIATFHTPHHTCADETEKIDQNLFCLLATVVSSSSQRFCKPPYPTKLSYCILEGCPNLIFECRNPIPLIKDMIVNFLLTLYWMCYYVIRGNPTKETLIMNGMFIDDFSNW